MNLLPVCVDVVSMTYEASPTTLASMILFLSLGGGGWSREPTESDWRLTPGSLLDRFLGSLICVRTLRGDVLLLLVSCRRPIALFYMTIYTVDRGSNIGIYRSSGMNCSMKLLQCDYLSITLSSDLRLSSLEPVLSKSSKKVLLEAAFFSISSW